MTCAATLEGGRLVWEGKKEVTALMVDQALLLY
jgi:hypothetical protein